MNFISPAYAQGVTGGAGMDTIMQLAPFGIILIIMYFLILRPQQRRAKEHQNLIKNVRRGDTIITSGGIIGKVTKATDDSEVEVEIAQNVKIRLLRQMITDVRAKTEPVKE
jgi:preprotein translocase subunit YajC